MKAKMFFGILEPENALRKFLANSFMSQKKKISPS